ncbi:MAG: heavy metal-binding domain-containing protein [Thermodesulfobacteriota bacterium]
MKTTKTYGKLRLTTKVGITLIIAAIYSVMMLSSCSSSEHDHDSHDHSQDESGHHQHIYTCPMNCEGSQGNKPGKCPVCGMDLVHSDKLLSSKSYRMDYRSDPVQIEAGKAATLTFRPIDESNEAALVPLDIVHEKKIHMMVFSKDLSYFEHIHPEYTASGDHIIDVLAESEDYSKGRGLKETKFLSGGDYFIFLDYTPSKAANQIEKVPIKVSGKEKAKIPLGDERLVWEGDGYTVTLGADKDFAIKTPIQLHINITKDGKAVNNLDNYLGALAHMVILSEDVEEYLHVHPMESKTTGPDIFLHTNFPKESKYKVFMQFNHNGEIHTINFRSNRQKLVVFIDLILHLLT